MDLLNIIKTAGASAVEASDPVKIVIGTVTKVSPLEITADSTLPISEDFLIITERVTKYEVGLKHKHGYIDTVSGAPTPKNTEDADYTESPLPQLVVRHGLKVGDKVVLLRVQGGQQFVVLDKVVSG